MKKLLLLLASTLTVMAAAPIAPSLPEIQRAFHTIPNIRFLTQLLLSVTSLSIAASAPIFGYIIDRYGRRDTFLVSLLISAFAGSAGLYLESMSALLLSRLLFGFGIAGTMTAATTLISDYYSGEEKIGMMSLQAAFMGFAGAVFLLLGGALADISWRAPFLVYLSALPLALWGWFVIDPPNGDRVMKEIEGLNIPWPRVLLIYLMTFIGMVYFFFLPVTIPFHLKQLFDASGFSIGVLIACCNLNGAIASLLYRRFHGRFGYVSVFALSFFLIGAGYQVVSLSNHLYMIGVGIGVIGWGVGLLVPNAIVWLTSIVPEKARGRLIGGATTSFFLGQFFSPILAYPFDYTDLYQTAAWVALGISALLFTFSRRLT